MIDIIEELLRDIQHNTKGMSRFVRTCDYAILGSIFTLIITQNPFAVHLIKNNKIIITLSGLMCIISLFLDYLQLIFGLFDSKKSIIKFPDNNGEGKTSVFTNLKITFFWSKQIPAIIGVILFIYAIFSNIFKNI